MPTTESRRLRAKNGLPAAARILTLVILSLMIAAWSLDLRHEAIDIPFNYNDTDPIWQLTLTKTLLDTGWILNNPFMGAPDVAHWYNNSAAQTSALHSVLLWCVGLFVHDTVATQQTYFILNFPLIAITGYIACRLIKIDATIAVCIGLLFAFLQTRYYAIFYAFLPNYFVIPLAIVPSIWVLTGKFAVPAKRLAASDRSGGRLRTVLIGRHFLVSSAVLAVTAATDGYYAFFTLLLLGFSGAMRALMGDIRRPKSLAAPLALICVLIAVALAVAEPLTAYRQNHRAEFASAGVLDTSIFHQPFEAEVYSTSLKVLVAPLAYNRIPALSRLGLRMIATVNQSRVSPVSQFASPGTLGSILLAGFLCLVALTLVRGGSMPLADDGILGSGSQTRSMLGAIAALSGFVLLCSIFGGIGTLIALIYPTIRAYERFPLFLTFLLFCGAGVMLTAYLARTVGPVRRWTCLGAVAVVTALGLLDQIPHPYLMEDRAAQYLAERSFVHKVEAVLPAGSAVYQYPYSQYLALNKYYGRASFAHMRLYLHSHALRWSNGASKNSPIDIWHTRMSELPVDQLVAEMQAVGFRGFIVDRSVVPDAEYAAIRTVLMARTGAPPMEDKASRLAFWTLPDPGYRLQYSQDYTTAERIVVTDAATLRSPKSVSRLIDRAATLSQLAGHANAPRAFDRSAYPAMFVDPGLSDGGLGLVPIRPASAMQGDVVCTGDAGRQLSVSHDTLHLTVVNRSAFGWQLNNGPDPIRFGLRELLAADGSRLRWDGGFRAPQAVFVPSGSSLDLPVSLAKADITTGVPAGTHDITAVFALVQDGVAWAAGGNCRVELVP